VVKQPTEGDLRVPLVFCIFANVKLLLGTTNAGKIVEITGALDHLPLTFLLPDSLGIRETPEETGETFAENALLKARFYHDRAKMPTLAEDSGLIVEALAGELGVKTRRWGAGERATDEEWITHFLKRMEKEENRRARFVCVTTVVDENGNAHSFEGICDGIITPTVESPYLPGLPIAGCFRPLESDRVYSALSVEEKNALSHRGRSLQKIAEFFRVEKNRAQ
jgi:XTP/dITP diphosphohydrolase